MNLAPKRKSKRELSFSKSTHLVLRLKPHLPPLFAPRDLFLRKKIFRCADKYDIRIYDLVFNHTHLHGVLLLPNRKGYVSFIRELTAMITNHFTHSLSIPGLVFKRIFSKRPFLRSTPWGRAYRALQKYMMKNENESGVSQLKFNEKAREEMAAIRSSPAEQRTLFDFQIKKESI